MLADDFQLAQANPLAFADVAIDAWSQTRSKDLNGSLNREVCRRTDSVANAYHEATTLLIEGSLVERI